MSYPTHVRLGDHVHKIARIDEHPDGPHHTHRVHLGCGLTIDVDIGGERMAARHRERAGHVLADQALGGPDARQRHAKERHKHAEAALAAGETWEEGRLVGGGDEAHARASHETAKALDAAEAEWYAENGKEKPAPDKIAALTITRDAARQAHADANHAHNAANQKRCGRWTRHSQKVEGCADCAAHEAGADPVVNELGHTPPTYALADHETKLMCPLCGGKIFQKRDNADQYRCSSQGHQFSKVELMDHIKTAFESLTK